MRRVLVGFVAGVAATIVVMGALGALLEDEESSWRPHTSGWWCS